MTLPAEDPQKTVLLFAIEALSSTESRRQEEALALLTDIVTQRAEEKAAGELPFRAAFVGLFQDLSKNGASIYVRIEAWCSRFGLGDVTAVPDFVACKDSGKLPPTTLENVANALGGVDDLGQLEILFRQKEAVLRVGVVRALGYRETPDGVPLLGAALSDPDQGVAFQAIHSLRDVLESDPAVSDLPAPRRDLYDQNPAKYLKPWRQWWDETGKSKYGKPVPTTKSTAASGPAK